MERNPDSAPQLQQSQNQSTKNHPVQDDSKQGRNAQEQSTHATPAQTYQTQDHQPPVRRYRTKAQRVTSITIIALCVILALIAALVGWSVYTNRIATHTVTGSTSANGANSASGSENQAANPLLDTSHDQCDVQLNVVASVNQWGSLAQSIGGKCANVTSIIASTSVEPHDYEPTPADLAKLRQADIVILNGAGYDPWATQAQLDAKQQHIITVSSLVGMDEHAEHAHAHSHSHSHAHTDSSGNIINPHLWFNLEAVDQAAHAIAQTYTQVANSGQTRTTVDKHFQKWDQQYEALTAHIAQLKAANAAAGKQIRFVSTESIIDDILADLGATNATPESYTNAMNSDAEPSAGDLQQTTELLKNGNITLLVLNPQELNSYAQRLQQTAKQAGIPMIEVSEQLPENQSDLLTWLTSIVNQIEQAAQAK